MRDILFIAAAGALGSLSRYGVGVAAVRIIGGRYAIGTLVVNVVGCFLLATLMTAGFSTELLPKAVKLAIATGFLGAFTTFSTFGYETMVYMERGDWGLAAANISANVVLGLMAAAGGFAVGKLVLST